MGKLMNLSGPDECLRSISGMSGLSELVVHVSQVVRGCRLHAGFVGHTVGVECASMQFPL